MKCMYCGEENVKTLDTRSDDETTLQRRRRVCNKCNTKFTTVEIPLSRLMLVQNLQATTLEASMKALFGNNWVKKINKYSKDLIYEEEETKNGTGNE